MRPENPYPSPVIHVPSASYLQTSLVPSKPLHPLAPSSSRKLLILDLNGTLLVRSPRGHLRQDPPTDSRYPQHHGRNNYLRLRHVYPRPYMPAFRAYLFAPSTLDWLDTMVWSSAQPPNVHDMVANCFGEQKDKLVAVWARDTLGLQKDEYRESSRSNFL
jgi:hypothetical protein